MSGKSTAASSVAERPEIFSKARTRRFEILQIAATFFAQKGFDATTVRDIAQAAGVLPGSLYHHFTSKEELFLEINRAGIQQIANSVMEAIEGVQDPWKRLEALAVAHCEALISTSELGVVISPYFSKRLSNDVRKQIAEQRDVYERLVEKIIKTIQLPSHIDAKIFRLQFLGALNWVPMWYNARRGYTPRQVALQLVAMFRIDTAREQRSLIRPIRKRPAAPRKRSKLK